jgi:hypothetical protein
LDWWDSARFWRLFSPAAGKAGRWATKTEKHRKFMAANSFEEVFTHEMEFHSSALLVVYRKTLMERRNQLVYRSKFPPCNVSPFSVSAYP